MAELQWLADPTAQSHQVYLGTNYWNVALADPSDPEYLGATASNTIALPPLQGNTRYYWRVE